MTTSNRPQPRVRVKPASDEAIDPIRNSQPAEPKSPTPPVQAPPAEAERRGPEPTVQLNVRIALTVNAKLEADIRKTGKTKKALVEEAILNFNY